jgi:hypothetical protein
MMSFTFATASPHYYCQLPGMPLFWPEVMSMTLLKKYGATKSEI